MPGVPEIRTPNRNRRGEQTRADLLEAAWRVVDRMSLVDLLAGLTPQTVASEAGMTTGAVRHHFEDADQLVRAMIDHHLETVDWRVLDQVNALVAQGHPFNAAAVRALAAELWDAESVAHETARRRRRVLVQLGIPHTPSPSGEDLRDVIVEGFWRPYFEASMPVVEQSLAAIGRTCIPPFRPQDLVRLMRAVLDGLQAQSTIEPGVIDGEFYANVLAALLVTLTAPADQRESLADLEARLRTPDVGLDTTDVEQLRSLAVASLGLFDLSVEGVTFSQIAAASGESIEVLVRRYGSVRRLAAVSFVEALPRIDAAASRHLTRDPMRALADTLCEIARMAQQHPHVAAALLFERSEEAIGLTGHRLWAGTVADLDVVAPVTDGVMKALRALPSGHRLDIAALAADMVDLTLLYGGTRRLWAPADVAGKALTLLPLGLQVSSQK